MGTFGGINIGAPVTDFMDGFIAGANYWNKQQGADVRVLGGRDPNDPAPARSPATSTAPMTRKRPRIGMLQEGADVILPVGGPIGQGTFAAIEERAPRLSASASTSTGPYRARVSSPDADAHPQEDRRVGGGRGRTRAELTSRREPVFVSTLENGGVGPRSVPRLRRHDFSQEVLDGIEALREAIIAGDVVPSDYYGE